MTCPEGKADFGLAKSGRRGSRGRKKGAEGSSPTENRAESRHPRQMCQGGGWSMGRTNTINLCCQASGLRITQQT